MGCGSSTAGSRSYASNAPGRPLVGGGGGAEGLGPRTSLSHISEAGESQVTALSSMNSPARPGLQANSSNSHSRVLDGNALDNTHPRSPPPGTMGRVMRTPSGSSARSTTNESSTAPITGSGKDTTPSSRKNSTEWRGGAPLTLSGTGTPKLALSGSIRHSGSSSNNTLVAKPVLYVSSSTTQLNVAAAAVSLLLANVVADITVETSGRPPSDRPLVGDTAVDCGVWLSVGESIITEVTAILRFIAVHCRLNDRYPGIYDVDLERRGRINEIMTWLTTHFLLYFGIEFVLSQTTQGVFPFGSKASCPALSQGTAVCGALFQELEDVFLEGASGKPLKYLAGDTLTLADYCAWPMVALSSHLQLSLASYPLVEGWLQRMSSLKGAVVPSIPDSLRRDPPSVTTFPSAASLPARYVPPHTTPCRVYVDPTDSGSRAIRLFIELNKYPIEVCVMNIHSPSDAERLAQLSASRRLPILEDGPWVCGEAASILQYLAVKHSCVMYPFKALEQAVVNNLMDLGNTKLYVYYESLFVRPQVEASGPLTNEWKEIIEFGRAQSCIVLEYLESLLNMSPYLAGSLVTIADVFLWGILTSGEVIGETFEGYPSVQKWLAGFSGTKACEALNAAHKELASAMETESYVHLKASAGDGKTAKKAK